MSICTGGNGASRTRTGDLLGAIQALSQLSYSPEGGTYVGSLRGCQASRGPRIRCLRVSFGRRLALFFLLIAVVPTVALLAILLVRQRGLAARARRTRGSPRACRPRSPSTSRDRRRDGRARRRLAGDPALAAAAEDGRPVASQGLRAAGSAGPGRRRGRAARQRRRQLAAAGPADAVAFARVGLADHGATRRCRFGSRRRPPERYVAEVQQPHRPRARGQPRTARRWRRTVPPPSETLEPDETADLSAGGTSTGRTCHPQPERRRDPPPARPPQVGRRPRDRPAGARASWSGSCSPRWCSPGCSRGR